MSDLSAAAAAAGRQGKAEWVLVREKKKAQNLKLGDGEEDGRGERPLVAKA